MQHSIPLLLCPCAPKSWCRQPAAPGPGEEEEEEGAAARPHLSWGHLAPQGHLRLAAVIVTKHNGLAASTPKLHKAPRGVSQQLQPGESQAGGVEWGDVIDGEV